MILQALAALYARKIEEGSEGFALEGWEWKEIPFVLVITREGKLVQIVDTQFQDDKKRKRAALYLVPQGVKKTSGVASNLLWESPSYIAGYKPDMKPERLQEMQQAFRQRIKEVFGEQPQDEGVAAVLAFLANEPLAQLQAFAQWKDIAETLPFMVFRLDGDRCRAVTERPEVKALLGAQTHAVKQAVQCLVTGKRQELAVLHPAIKGVAGAQSVGANIVSFNAPSYTSFGKSQGENAPVSIEAADAYTKALNWMLGKDSKQKLQLGDTTVVFWAKELHPIESVMNLWFADVPKGEDEAERTQAVASLYNSPWHGKQVDYSEPTSFYILGLSPNAARISVRFWVETTVAEAAHNIRRYFDEIALDSTTHEPPPSLRRLLSSVCHEYKLENMPPKLEGDVMRAILQGTRYPRTLLMQTMLRMKAERSVNASRAALCKAYLTRNEKESYTMALDEKNTKEAYVLGRLFATLEKAQEDSGGAATLRERYYGAASTRPASTFSLLLRLHQHHMDKLKREKRGAFVNMDKQVGEILNILEGHFPPLLSLENQGRFALGYYQQRQAFYTKKEAVTEEAAA